ncbi:4Fe-4S binding protein [Vibrio maerlii]|uniref:4Fe-4S binding protein n=1 Tax=Vibrio maerlii TaxID=2231648 RepID=UPI000E3DB0D2|nr:4Fe-4S dicluster domain-containing protein [Vibrio maerlii]
MLKEQLKQSTSTNGKARYYAVNNTVELANLIPPTVSYQSAGNLLIVGPTSIIEDLIPQFTSMNSVTLLSTDGVKASQDAHATYYADSVAINGFLGTFTATVSNKGTQSNLAIAALNHDCFDVVLDMTLTGIMEEEVPVPGYYPVGRGYPPLNEALEEVPTLMGTFDKPKFFRLDTDLCAHSSRGVKGCERCVDACPAGALSSQGSDKTGYNIDINPYLCQGIGTCATACPTEAIHYALPNPQDTQKFVERTLANYFKVGGENPIVLFCSSRHEMYNLMALKALPDNVVPIVVEELPSVGIDTWFAALVNGASQVLFAASQHMPKTIIQVMTQEVGIAQSLLTDLGLPVESIDILFLESLRQGPPSLIDTPNDMRFGDLEGSKRQRLYQALDHVNDRFAQRDDVIAISTSAPFGKVNCASQDCTLCMGCVAVCPTKALYNDGESPALQFIEQDCIQCGMCTKACPENALTLSAQINWNAGQRQSVQTLHEEKAAECLRCGKPFAPQSMITMLQDKLRGHSHFSDQTAINRIAMCEDCRVVDVFEALAEDPNKQLDY